MKERLRYPAFAEYDPKTGKYGGFVVDLPVYVAGKASLDEAKEALAEGVTLYLAYLESEGKPAPEPGSHSLPDLEEEIKVQLTPVWV